MSNFADVVRLAQQNSLQQKGLQQKSATQNFLQPVVEKELLHHEILRAMAEAGLLHQLTFIGGTCLRTCYGSNRLSEDLDFTGGSNFTSDVLRDLGAVVAKSVRETYGLGVIVSEPQREEGNVSTWKIQVQTNPGSRHLPQQRINIDICAVKSYERRPMVLRNHYGIDLGTSGLIIQAESRHEILADKMLALALRPGRIKHRDLWDIAWLVQQNETCDPALVQKKCEERGITSDVFRKILSERLATLSDLNTAFIAEMSRFLPQTIRQGSIDKPEFWSYLCNTVRETAKPLIGDQAAGEPIFRM